MGYIVIVVIAVVVSVVTLFWWRKQRAIALKIARGILHQLRHEAAIDDSNYRMITECIDQGVNLKFSMFSFLKELGVSHQEMTNLIEVSTARSYVMKYLHWLSKGDETDSTVEVVMKIIAKHSPLLDDLRPSEADIQVFRQIEKRCTVEYAMEELNGLVDTIIEAVKRFDAAVKDTHTVETQPEYHDFQSGFSEETMRIIFTVRTIIYPQCLRK